MRNPRSPKNQRGFPHSGFGRPCRSGRMWRCHELGRSRRALLPGEIWWKDLELAWIERSPPPESLERICCNISRIFVGHPKLRPKLSCETVVPCGTLWYPVVPCAMPYQESMIAARCDSWCGLCHGGKGCPHQTLALYGSFDPTRAGRVQKFKGLILRDFG